MRNEKRTKSKEQRSKTRDEMRDEKRIKSKEQRAKSKDKR